jgi:hypothetical protein
MARGYFQLAFHLHADQRRQLRQQYARSAADTLQAWLLAQRHRVPEGGATVRAIDYSLGRWVPMTRYLDDGNVPIDNNWLFAGSLCAGQRAAAIMSLIQSAKLNGKDAFPYMKDVPKRLPGWTNSRIDDLLPNLRTKGHAATRRVHSCSENSFSIG